MTAVERLTVANRRAVLSLITTPYHTIVAQFKLRQTRNQQAIAQYVNVMALHGKRTSDVNALKTRIARAGARQKAKVLKQQHLLRCMKASDRVNQLATRYVARNKILSATAKRQLCVYERKLATVVAADVSRRQSAVRTKIRAMRQGAR